MIGVKLAEHLQEGITGRDHIVDRLHQLATEANMLDKHNILSTPYDRSQTS